MASASVSSQSALLPLDSMTLRPVEPRDFSAIATLSTAAMMEDDLIDYICPYRHKHPESLRQYFLRSVKQIYYSVDEHALAVEIPDADDASQPGSPRMKLVGHAVWRRDGDGEKARVWRKRGSWADSECCFEHSSIVVISSSSAIPPNTDEVECSV